MWLQTPVSPRSLSFPTILATLGKVLVTAALREARREAPNFSTWVRAPDSPLSLCIQATHIYSAVLCLPRLATGYQHQQVCSNHSARPSNASPEHAASRLRPRQQPFRRTTGEQHSSSRLSRPRQNAMFPTRHPEEQHKHNRRRRERCPALPSTAMSRGCEMCSLCSLSASQRWTTALSA